MLNLLGQSFLSPNDPSFYDMKAKSHQELLANMYAKVNECVEEINSFTESMNNQMEEFLETDAASKQEHMTAIRQEFQDFINVIDLKVMELEKQIDDAENFMRTNIKTTTKAVVEQELRTQSITVDLTYDETDESLRFVVVESEV